MSLTRRSFLLGAGTIITASFVKEVATAVADTRSPLLIKPAEAAKAIYYETVEDHWRLHLGQPAFEIPKPQLLIDNLRWHGHLLDTQEQIDTLCDDEGWTVNRRAKLTLDRRPTLTPLTGVRGVSR